MRSLPAVPRIMHRELNYILAVEATATATATATDTVNGIQFERILPYPINPISIHNDDDEVT